MQKHPSLSPRHPNPPPTSLSLWPAYSSGLSANCLQKCAAWIGRGVFLDCGCNTDNDFERWTFLLFNDVWKPLVLCAGCQTSNVSICSKVLCCCESCLHSWILCNCEGPLLNYVPGNLIFTAAPDRNHLHALIRLTVLKRKDSNSCALF